MQIWRREATKIYKVVSTNISIGCEANVFLNMQYGDMHRKYMQYKEIASKAWGADADSFRHSNSAKNVFPPKTKPKFFLF